MTVHRLDGREQRDEDGKQGHRRASEEERRRRPAYDVDEVIQGIEGWTGQPDDQQRRDQNEVVFRAAAYVPDSLWAVNLGNRDDHVGQDSRCANGRQEAKDQRQAAQDFDQAQYHRPEPGRPEP